MRHLKQTRIWFLSYACTFLICIITGRVVTRFSEHILLGQIKETMSIAFDNSIKTVENRIESQQINMYAVLESDGVTTLSNKYLHPDRGTQLELARRIMDTMIIQYANIEYTDDNLICFRDIDMVVGMNDSFDKLQAYRRWFSDVYSSPEEWQNDMFSLNNMTKFRPFRDSMGHQKIAVIQKRLRSIGATPSVVAVSFIDVEKLFGKMYGNPLYKIFVLSDGKQICTSHDGSKYETIVENGTTVYFDDEEYTQYGREQNLLYFIQLFDNRNYTKRLSVVSRIGIIINIGVLIVGILLSFFFTRINYTPLRRVTSRLKLDLSDENEYVAIEKGIENILQDRKNITRKLKENDERLYEAYNKMLINVSSNEDARLIADNLSMNFKYKNFAICYFKIQDIGSVSSETDTQKENMKIATFCIINVYRELLPDSVVCDFCIINNTCCCILNFSDTALMNEIHQSTLEVCEFLRENLEMKLVYFISRAGNLENIPDMRRQIAELEKFCDLLNNTGFYYNEYTEYLKTIYDKYYRNELVHAADSGNMTEAVIIINRFINMVMGDKCEGEEYKDILIRTLLQTYKEINPGEYSHYYNKAEQAIETNNDIKNIKSAFIRLYKTLVALKKHTDGKEDETICSILEFIEENYADENLNVSYISEKMNMSISQLSRYFKNNTNEGLAEYILRYRCKKAAELLDNHPEMTISEVGKYSGFGNSISFIRAFKRIYDTTPGKYNQKKEQY